MQEKILKGKTAIITGSNRGIGLEVLKLFASEGANIYACSRVRSESLEEIAREMERQYDSKVWPVYFDMHEEAQIKEGIADIVRRKTPIDILVNNAGMPFGASFQMTSQSKLKEVFQVNYFAQIQMMQQIARVMIKQKYGCIINMASVGGIEAEPGYLAYGSSKAALIFATRCLASEVANLGIRVNAVAPGLTQTHMGSYKSEEERGRVLRRTPMGRMALPKEIADVVLFLASDASAYMTGQILQVDGGRRI